jgi:septum formation protein
VSASALAKARSVLPLLPACASPRLVLGSDTVVALAGAVLEKPTSTADAKAMLASLSGREHTVHTGVCLLLVCAGGRVEERVFSEETGVTFSELSEADVDAYVDSGDGMDKAGGYGAQSRGGQFVERIEGDYWNVVGLPMNRVSREIGRIAEGMR